jgi:hypothetical protein
MSRNFPEDKMSATQRQYATNYRKPPIKLSRDCRRIVAGDWFRQVFPTRLSAQRQAMSEFETTAQGCHVLAQED